MAHDDIRQVIDRLRVIQEDGLDMDTSSLAKLNTLAKAGLVPEDEVAQVKMAVTAMNAGRMPTAQQRTVLLDMLGKFIEVVTDNPSMFSRMKGELDKGGDS
jgi:hypothetical protein